MASKSTGSRKAAADDRTRVFPPAPPAIGSRAAFAETWWGRAWVSALEDTSMDAGRLSRGRTYARRGAVDQITVSPGMAKAKVRGSAPRPYASSMAVKQLSAAEWDRFLDAVAARAAHIAALLDHDMPPELVADAQAAGVPLLPGVGDLTPDCSCPDWGWPCKHASALCYQIARLLDIDPFVLLLLRGRGEQELMEELRTRNAAASAHAAAQATAGENEASPTVLGTVPAWSIGGVSAADAFGSAAAPGEMTAAILALETGPAGRDPGTPPVLAAAREPQGIDQAGLEMVAADTARRAHALLTAYTTTPEPARTPALPRLSTWQDAVRFAAHAPEPEAAAKITDAFDVDEADLRIAAAAWRQGGPAGLTTLEQPWSPDEAAKARARRALEDGADEELPLLRLWRNRWTAETAETAGTAGVQIRLGTDGRWYPYRRDPDNGRWRPDGPAEHDPAAALAGLLGAGRDT